MLQFSSKCTLFLTSVISPSLPKISNENEKPCLQILLASMCLAAQTSLLISGSRRSIYTEVNFSLHPDILTENKTSEMGQTPPACSRSSHKTYSCVERREIILFFPPSKGE